MGDVKLSLSLGAVTGWYGWLAVFIGALVAFVAGAVYGGIVRILRRRAGRESAVPFGPMMFLGALFGLLWGT